MPELPEVQTVVNDLIAAALIGRRFASVRVFWPRTVHGMSVQAFCRRIRGLQILAIRRRGKFIVMELARGRALLIHLRMTGRLFFARPDAERDRHEHVLIDFDDGRQLRFHDTRKFGRFYLVADPAEIVGHLGPEPLDEAFGAEVLARGLQRSGRQIKPLLLDQTFVAGVGNIYVDEALWDARIDPRRTARALRPREIRALYRSLVKVLRQGLANMGTTLGSGQTNFYSVAGYNGRNRDALKVFRRADQPCPRCKTAIRRLVVGQRSTFICDRCQK